jgi:UPF0176 protein
LFIQCDACAARYEGCCSDECKEEKNLTPDEQRERRAGRENGMMIFNKSKEHPLRKHRSEWESERDGAAQ